MRHHWIARGGVLALHLGLVAALWPQRLPHRAEPRDHRLAVRLIASHPPRATAPATETTRHHTPATTRMAPPSPSTPAEADTPANAPRPPAAAAEIPPAPTPTEPPRTALRLTLPPGYAASAAAARNPALSDARSNTARPTLEDRIGDATGGAGAWVEQHTSDNLTQSVGALGERRTVLRRGNVCVEVFRSHIADTDGFNANVAPRAVGMVGKPYTCR